MRVRSLGAAAAARHGLKGRWASRRAKDWSEVLKEQFEVQENRLEALRSAPPSPDAGEWVDGVYHSHTGLNPENNATDNTYKTATLVRAPAPLSSLERRLASHTESTHVVYD
jgi:proteasome lid subunit RPN8/RPN11